MGNPEKQGAILDGAHVDPALDAAKGEAISGHLDGVDDEGRLLFRGEGTEDSLPVVIGIPTSDGELVKAAWTQRRALVLRTTDRRPRLVLIALLRERVAATARDAKPGELEVVTDGETLRLRAATEIELVCGRSRLVLKKDGRVEVNGSYLLSRSRGPVKIKGASVEIN